MIKAPSNETELKELFREIYYGILVRDVRSILKSEVKEMGISVFLFERILGMQIDTIRYEDLPVLIENLKKIFPKTAIYIEKLIERYEDEFKGNIH